MALGLLVAFDTLDHKILLRLLQKRFSIDRTCLEWFNAYLRPRFYKVNVGNVYFKECELDCSVPQGSCTGPVLYLAYASGLQDVIPRGMSLHGFADDHSLKKSFHANKKNRNLEKNNPWSRRKCDKNQAKDGQKPSEEFILYGSRHHLFKCETTSISANGNSIKRAECIKYLWVNLDSNLNMKKRGWKVKDSNVQPIEDKKYMANAEHGSM